MPRALLAFLLITALPPSAGAQGDLERRGAWGQLTLGAGTAGVSCGFCNDGRHWAPSGAMAFGGTPSRRLLLGGGASGFARTEGETDTYLGWAYGLVRAYPLADANLHVSGGAGVVYGRGTTSTDDFDALGAGFLIGVGWDFGLAPNLAITATANMLLSAGGYLEQNGVETSDAFNPTLFQFGAGVTLF